MHWISAQGVVTNRLVPLLAERKLSEQVTRCLSQVVVLRPSDQVQWNVLLLLFHDGDFEATDNLNVPLAQSGRLLCL